MKVIIFRKSFTKRFKKLQKGEQKRCEERIVLFQNNSQHPLLQDHALQGTISSRRSINIGGDLRALYRVVDTKAVQFITISTHSELYN